MRKVGVRTAEHDDPTHKRAFIIYEGEGGGEGIGENLKISIFSPNPCRNI